MAGEIKAWADKKLNPPMDREEVEEWVDKQLKSVMDKRDAIWFRLHQLAVEREELLAFEREESRENYVRTSEDYRKWIFQGYMNARAKVKESKVWQKFMSRVSTIRKIAKIRIPRIPQRLVREVLNSRLSEYEAKRDEMFSRLETTWKKEAPYPPPFSISQYHQRVPDPSHPGPAPGEGEPASSTRPPSYDGPPPQQPLVSAVPEVTQAARATRPPHAAFPQGPTPPLSPPPYSPTDQRQPHAAPPSPPRPRTGVQAQSGGSPARGR
jgi:hypothetical protein